MSDTVKVKRDGPRGWHNIAAASYDPAKHELFDDKPNVDAPAQGGTVEDFGAHGSEITDDQLRAAIEKSTGKKPHWKSSRQTLLEQFHAINGA